MTHPVASVTPDQVPEVDVHTLKGWLESAEPVLLIDVREEEEWDEEHLPEALLLPMSELEPEQVPSLDGRRLVVMCRSGRRSAAVVARLARLGVADGLNLAGGILAWMEAGYPVRDAEAAKAA